MYVVIVGDLELGSTTDEARVNSLIDTLRAKYSDLIVVSGACDRGIGLFVRNRCVVAGKETNSKLIAFCEILTRIWFVKDRASISRTYLEGRNPGLSNLGEEFHVFSSGRKGGWVSDLIIRVKNRADKPPLTIYLPDGKEEKYNVVGSSAPSVAHAEAKETIQSSSLRDVLEEEDI